MSEYFDSIMRGMSEAIADAEGKERLSRRSVTITPVKVYAPEEIKGIRSASGLSQRNFAGYMGVSVKTVEAWEAGTNSPSGAASRLLSIMEIEKDFMSRYPFVKIT